MSIYHQYDGSMSQSTMAQRLLDNGSDYLAVRVGQNEYLFVQGSVKFENGSAIYSGESWLYSGSYSGADPTLEYLSDDSGSVKISYPYYVYSSDRAFQSLAVQDVFPRYCFFGILAFIVLFVGFNLIRKRWIV